mmetsp:Transcript_62411/g.145251  ORF Transcript_62411/g.145251 Transcript_62411/m.145251 type:complete len:939 (+) Transcript_62411:39-2855(+)
MALRTVGLLAVAWQAAAASAPAYFDCTAEYANWEAEWSGAKKAYCCQNSGLGCEATTTTSCSVDCSVGLNNWQAGWSTWKKEWCCKHERLGCPDAAYQCDVGVAHTWPTNKQEWCCKNKGIGCATTTTTSCHVDCQAGLNNWEAGWATYKKEWCCKHEKLGCPRTSTTTTTATTVTTTRTTTTVTATTTASTTTSITTVTTTTRTSATTTTRTTVTTETTITETTLPYDCKRLEDGVWTVAKREWCCENEQRGCVTSTATTSTTLPYDCFADYTSCYHCLERRWPYAKRSWCCEHVGRGCTTTKTFTATTTSSTTATLPYDCRVHALGNQTGTWSSAKREWCCAHAHTGCTTTATSTTATTVTATSATATATATATSTTTTFDCSILLEGVESHTAVHSWSAERKAWCCEHKHHGCPTTSTTTTTRRVPDSEVMTCDLNCFGAAPVPLPGSVGAGKGASLNDVSLQECRNVCGGTKHCEGVLFTNRTEGVPWKSMCFGKRDIRTSKCQPGGSYLTELIGQRPWGKCAVFGDPHVITWDRVYGPPITMTDPGEYYLVKSEHLSIHGRFGYTHRFPTASSTVGIALGGRMLGGHSLVVTYVGPETGFKGFEVFWDGKRILRHYPSTYASEDGILRASHDAMDPLKYHREGRHTIGGTEGLLPSYYFQLKDLNVYMLLGPDNCNAVIETRKVPGEQDGYCGNFNCNKEDDNLEALRKRGMAEPIPAGESLFKYGKKPPAWVMTKVAVPSIKDCDPRVKAKAVRRCKGLPNGEEKACIFDACAANSTEAAGEDVVVLARAPEEAQGCDRLCHADGLSATCEARIRYAALHKYQHHEMPCLKAHELVLRRCSSCSNCSSKAVGCTGSEEQFRMRFQRLYSPVEAPELSQRASRRPAGIVVFGGLCAGLVLATGFALVRTAMKRTWLVQESSEHVALLDGGLHA